jgi:hypothetical protein
MLFTVRTNGKSKWRITPVTGALAGLVVAVADVIEMTSVFTRGGKLEGSIKAAWGLEIDEGADPYSDLLTIKALGVGGAFKDGDGHEMRLSESGLYDVNTGVTMKQCSKLTLLGSKVIRRA